MFGRGPELQLLHDCRRALSGGRGSVVLVGGEAGIGKSRLVSEFTATLHGGRAPYCAVGEALEDAPRPFGPFRAILTSLIAACPGLLAEAEPIVRRTLAALVPDAVALAGCPVPPRERMEKAELFTGILRYYAAIAKKRATIVLLEDVHWADSATLEMLVHLAPRLAGLRLLVIATYRDDEIAPSHRLFTPLARLAREDTVRRITLEPLGTRDIRDLVADALGSEFTLPADSIRDVVTGCDGNPLFAEEMLKHAVESHGRGRFTPQPISIRALTLERIAPLGEADRALLNYAAALGRQFGAGTLASVTERPLPEVVAALRRLRDVGVIVEETEPRVQVRFRHALVRQIIYGELPPDAVQSMHAHIVEMLEREPERDVDALAYHAARAGVRERILRYSESAGDAALAVRAAAQAASYYERALELVDDEDTRIRLYGKLGEAHLQQSDFGPAAAAFKTQHCVLAGRGEYDAAARALTRAAAEEANAGRIREALEALLAFQAEHWARLSRRTADHLNASIARIATAAEDFALAERSLAAITDPAALEPFTHQVYWLARLFSSEHALDREGWRSAAAALQRRNPETYPLMRAQMLHSIASTAIPFAETGTAEHAVDAALAIDREFGLFRALAFASAVKASILAVCGRLPEARSCIEAALDEPDLFVVRLELALGAAPVALALSDDELAVRLLHDEFGTALRQAGMESAAGLFDGMRSARLFALGRDGEARPLLDRSLAAPQHPFGVVHFWPFAGQHATDAQLRRLRMHCADAARKRDAQVARACLALLDGAFDRAASLYRELGWPLHEANALERSGMLDKAVTLYRRCGAVRDLRRLRSQAPAGAEPASGHLSRREREVASMVGRGLTNRRIAQELCVSEKTIEKHVSSIFAKLDFSTRAQLAAHVARQSL